MKSIRYIALLRGINVGGNKKVSMALLKDALEHRGYRNVKTFLNSGNVMFESDNSDLADLTNQTSALLERTFAFPIPVILRTSQEIQTLIDSQPFAGITVTPNTRLYITFLGDLPIRSKEKLKIPFVSSEGDVQILNVIHNTVCSVITISTNKNTTDLMGLLETEFGKNVTTRNWNTVIKLIDI